MDDYYMMLGCDYDSDVQQIKLAYRNIVKEKHPDHGGNQADFLDIARAYDVLVDGEKRAGYDREIGIRSYDGTRYRLSRPKSVTVSQKDLYDDIKEVIRLKLGFAYMGSLYMEIKEVDIFRNRDGTVLLAPELKIICPKCMGFGGWLGRCRLCGGTGRTAREFLIPFELTGKLEKGDKIVFEYKKIKVALKVT
jgi:DnaJ-class molecular chaperone